MIVQIYEVTSPAEARGLGAMGVDHIGVLVGDGSFPREQTIEERARNFCGDSLQIKIISVIAFSRRGSDCAAHRGVTPRYPPSRRGATISLANSPANTQSGVSADFANAEHSRR